jgi:hypothetical protein
LSAATGPKSQVIGAKTIPYVAKMRLTPVGYPRAVEYRGLCPWEIAYAGHDVYQMEADESPHPQIVMEVGWPVHRCNQMMSDTRR